MSPTPDWDLDRYRPLLRLQIRSMELDPRLRRRFDSSDLIQETMLRAHANRAGFRGKTEAELLKWLQEILANVASDEVRKARAQKRDLALEQSLEAVMADSSARLNEYLASNQSSPSRQAERQEQLLRLAAAIDQLPEDQRDVVIQRDLLDASVAQIALQLGRTEKSCSRRSGASNGLSGWARILLASNDYVRAFALQTDGRVLLAGSARPTSNTYPTDVALVRFLASAPQIGSFTATPNPVTSGSSTTSSVTNITDANPNATVAQVAFYIMINGNWTLLGYGTHNSDGSWSYAFDTTAYASGTYTICAQATDNYGALGNPVALTLTVQ